MRAAIGVQHTNRSILVDPRNLRIPVKLNEYDACLADDYNTWSNIVDSGGLHKLCCPTGRRPYRDKPWIAMPKEGRRFKPIGYFNVATAVPFVSTVDHAVFSVYVPLGYDGVITDLVCEDTAQAPTGFVEGSGDITWRLDANGRYLRDLGNIKTTLGSLITPSPTPRGGIRVYSRDKITFSVAFAAGAEARLNPAGVIVCSITGWWYPR